MTSSVRDYAILWVGARTGAGGSAALGGNALLTTAQHALDGPEHTNAGDGTRLDASVDHHGLLPILSGTATDVLAGTGTFRDNDAAEVSYDPTSSGLVSTDVQAAIDEVAAGSASSPDAAEDGSVVVSAPTQ